MFAKEGGRMRFLRDDRGVTTVEYVMIAALIAVGVFAAVQALRNALGTKFNQIANAVQGW